MVSKEKKPVSPQEDSAKSELARRFKANPLVFIGTVIVLVIVIIAFVFVPAIVPSAGGLSGDLSFGSYGKIPIAYVPGNYFALVREAIASSRQSSMDDSNYVMANLQTWRQAFEEAVIHTAILAEMKKAGYVAPEKVVDRRVAELPQFWENGVFSVAKYRQLDNTARMSLWHQEGESITQEYYLTDITELKIPSKEVSFMSAMASPRRTFDMAAFSFGDYPDTEISAYARANPELFRVTHLSRITINSSEREARQILAGVQEGTTTFEDAARTHSQDGYADRGGDMGIRMAYEFIREIPDTEARESLITLAKGGLSSLIKVESGWAFFRAEEASYAANTGDVSLLEKIRAYIMEFARGRIEDFFINQAEELIAAINEQGFDEALLEKEMDKRSFGPLPINYGEVSLFTTLRSFSVPELSAAQSNENFWRIAFITPLHTPSTPLVVGSNVIVLYPLEESSLDEINISYTETAYSSYWLPYYINQNIRSYFLNNAKLEDRFFDTYFKYIQPSN